MKIYFLAIGGTAMGNLAILLKSQGHEICGTDTKVYPPMSELLERAKIPVFEGYSATRLQSIKPDLVVIGNAVSRGNEEVEFLLNSKQFPFVSLPSLIHDKVIGRRNSIVITGTHGKTTTTALTAFSLDQLGLCPGYFIGGAPLNFETGAAYGRDDSPFVIEGDEYDSAFFDKRSKFVHYAPKILVINNIELDHIDIFRDLEDIKRTFSHVIKLVPSDGCIVANGDSDVIRTLLPVSWTHSVFVGETASNDYRIRGVEFSDSGTKFSLEHADGTETISSPLFGMHNVRNVAIASVAVRYLLGKFPQLDWSRFRGVKKRQEVIFKNQQTVIIEDFAHHPTAIAETIRAVKQAFPDYDLLTAFEPRSNTACSPCFQGQFVGAFCGSDEVYIVDVFKNKSNSLDTSKLAREVQERMGIFSQAVHVDALYDILAPKLNSKRQIFLFLSNGNFSGISKKIRDIASL